MSKTINVFWHDRARMSFSCCAMLNQMFDSYPTQHYAMGETRPDGGAVIVFHGGNNTQIEVAHVLRKWAEGRPWTIYISVGDENCDFAYSWLERSNSRLWVQTPKPGKVTADRYLIEGPPADCRPLLDAAGPVRREYDWFFAGQINHPRREKLAEVLRAYPYGPHAMMETKSFGVGMPHEMYYKLMKQAYVVPCPSGLATPDSFRFAEALEAGCVPVVDACAPDGVMGYWKMVLGEHPFIEVEDWGDFSDICHRLLTPIVFQQHQKVIQKWWSRYKTEFGKWLEQDILSLTGWSKV